MASLKLNGDVSGEITISAPSVAGTHTLTLPSTSETLATQNSLGVRNLIINGDMRIAQRGTSSTGQTTGGYVSVDRFYTGGSTAGTWTISQDTDTPSGQGFATSLKMDCTTANASLSAGSYWYVEHKIEAQNCQHLKKGTANAQSVTLSFWVKSNKTGTYTFELHRADSGRHISNTYTINVANTWEKKTITINADTTGVINNDNGEGLRCMFWVVAGTTFTSGTLATSWATLSNPNRVSSSNVNLADSTSNDWYLTGVQLEVGTEATPFEHRPYDMELARCQRYYSTSIELGQTITDFPSFGAGRPGATFFCSVASGNDLFGNLQLPVAMRATPTFNIYSADHRTSGSVRDGASGANISVANFSFSTGNNKSIVYMNGLSGTVLRPYNFHWTASAEL